MNTTIAKSRRVGIVVLLMSMMLVNALDRGSLAVAAPFIIKDFHINSGLMGIALSAFFWTYIPFNVPVGRLADKFGAKLILGLAAALWSLASAATGLVQNWAELIATRLTMGIGEAAGNIVGIKVIVDNFPSEEKGAATTWFLSGVRLGMAITPFLMGFLIAYWNWRAAFLITGLGGLLWCVVWHYGYTDVTRDAREAATRAKQAVPWKQLLTNRCVLGLMIAKFLQNYLFVVFVTWVPSYLVLEKHFTIIKMGIWASIPWVVGFFASPAVGCFSDWLIRKDISITKARKYSLMGCQLCDALVVAVGYINDPMLAVLLLTMNIAAASSAAGMMWTLLAEVAPRNLGGSVTGAINTIASMSGIFAPAITGFIFKFTGSFRDALLVAGLGELLSVAVVLFMVPAITPIQLSEKHSTKSTERSARV